MGPHVLEELDGVIDRKSPQSKPYVALLLERAKVQVGDTPSKFALHQASQAIAYLPDAQIVAEAIALEVDYFVSFDRDTWGESPRPTRYLFLWEKRETFSPGTEDALQTWLTHDPGGDLTSGRP
jgi:hypothetical protein